MTHADKEHALNSGLYLICSRTDWSRKRVEAILRFHCKHRARASDKFLLQLNPVTGLAKTALQAYIWMKLRQRLATKQAAAKAFFSRILVWSGLSHHGQLTLTWGFCIYGRPRSLPWRKRSRLALISFTLSFTFCTSHPQIPKPYRLPH